MKWSHVGLNCRDLAASEEFYTALFGFHRARAVPIGADDQIVFLRNGDAYLELFSAQGEGAPPATADGPAHAGVIRHLAFQVDDLDEFLDGLDRTIPITLGPLEFHDIIPGWRTVWISDPDGVVVEVSQGYRDAPAAGRAGAGSG
jgi:glyoxylase I family protein